jgi:putative drug exporter of the RND superfamily
MNALLARLGRIAARRHWLVIAGWLAVLIGLGVSQAVYGGTYTNNYNVPGSQSQNGLNVLNATYPQQGGYSGQLVFHAPHGTVAQQRGAVDQATANVGRLADVTRTVSPFAAPHSPAISRDGTIAYSTVAWTVLPASLTASYLDSLNRAVQPARAAGLTVDYGGGAGQIGQAIDDRPSEIIGLSCAFVLLLIMFVSALAAAMPLVSAIVSVFMGLSVVKLLAAVTTFPTTAPIAATLLGLGVGVDYGLFLTARHREQIDAGMDITTSAARTERTSGAAIVVAGGTVIVSILGLYVADVPFVGAMGLAAAIVVAVTMLASLTLIPAFMGLLGDRLRSLAVRREARRQRVPAADMARRLAAGSGQRHERSAFARWGRRVSGQPWPWAAVSVAVLVVLAIPLFSMTMGQLDAGTNPTSDSSRRAYDLLSQGFGVGINGPLTVVVSLPKQSPAANQSLLASLQHALATTGNVASASQPSVNSAGTTAVITVIPKTRPQATQTTGLVNTLRDSVLPAHADHATTYVTGSTAGAVDFTQRTSARLPWLILAVVAIAFLMLTMAFRSVVIAIKAAVLNLLSVGAAYGVIVAVFQWGWGSGLLGIGQTVPIPAYVPMMVFAIVFGLSMDYEVFLLSRVHESWLGTGDPHRSVAIGIGATARVITTAAGVMVVVFLSFVLQSDPSVKMLAVGMAAAVLIDASIVRMVLVPAIMSLLGRAAWWLPRWLEPLVPRVELEEASQAPAGARSR